MNVWFRHIRQWYRRISGSVQKGIDPDEVLIDATNLPAFDEHQFEGRIERPIAKRALGTVGVIFLLIALVFVGRLWFLQVYLGGEYAAQSEENRLRHTLLFSDRGVMYDRRGVELAWNTPNEGEPFARRTYAKEGGLAHVLGYVNYPQKDAAGVFYQEAYVGKDSVEEAFDAELAGENGIKLVETNARGEIQSESVVRQPLHGSDLTLTIDVQVQTKLFELIASTSQDVGFRAGAGIVMDVHTGEILVLTSYPEYNSNVLSSGKDVSRIASSLRDERKPFLNRAVAGLYTPGSIAKPFIAAGVLEEDIINPRKEIVSTGSIRVPNPYLPGTFSVFSDWRAHGPVDLRRALAVSSNVYFYYVGGGFEDQEGLGIEGIGTYMREFGFGKEVDFVLTPREAGTIPSPAWKEAMFDGEPWRVGDTYNTVIGQYGFQVTPLQVARAVAAVANGGTLPAPTLRMGEGGGSDRVDVAPENLQIVREGMRLAVTDGTAAGLDTPSVAVAAKTGTAELGAAKDFVNSWATGFFPYDNPRFAFVVVMERGPSSNVIGGVSVMRQLLDWMRTNTPGYLVPEGAATAVD